MDESVLETSHPGPRPYAGVRSGPVPSYILRVKQDATFDSSFWIHAHRSGLLPYVLAEYSLHDALAVAAELWASFPSGLEFWRLALSGVLGETTRVLDAVGQFGPGERAAISVAVENPPWLLLIDDLRPLQYAVRAGLRAVCSPVLIVTLYVGKHLTSTEAMAIFARLTALRTVSPSLLVPAFQQLAAAVATQGESIEGNAETDGFSSP